MLLNIALARTGRAIVKENIIKRATKRSSNLETVQSPLSIADVAWTIQK